MRNLIVLVTCLLLSSFAYSQQKVRVYDESTKKTEIVDYKAVYEVDSIAQILDGTYPEGSRIVCKGLDRKGEAIFYVESAIPSGLVSDSLGVIPEAGGSYAIVQPDKNGFYHAEWFGAIPDDGNDDYTAWSKMLPYLSLGLKGTAKKGEYSFSRPLYINNIDSLSLKAEKVVIKYPSGNTSLTSSSIAEAITDEQARSCLLINESTHVQIEGLSFEGDSSDNIADNLGVGIYAIDSDYLEISNCNQEFGKAIYVSNSSNYVTVSRCVSNNTTGASNPSSNTLYDDCVFQKDTSSYWDRIGSVGSSHGIYAFAGNSNIIVDNCTFINIRTDAVKFSGSSAGISNISVINSYFEKCGVGVDFGADDVVDGTDRQHTGLYVNNNKFVDCSIIRTGWLGNAAITMLGSDNVTITNNTFEWSQDRGSGVPNAVRAIKANKFGSTTEPLSNYIITGNTIRKTQVNTITGPVLIFGIDIEDVNNGDVGGKCIISGNSVEDGVSQSGFSIVDVLNLDFNNNTVEDCTQYGTFDGIALGRVYENGFGIGNNATNGVHMDIDRCGFTDFYDNYTYRFKGTNKEISFRYSYDGVNDQAIPINGYSGIVDTTGLLGKDHLVFAYGGAWVAGDEVDVFYNGGTSTFVFGTDFSSKADLIADIDGIAGISARDYASPLSSPYILVYEDTIDDTDREIYVECRTTNSNAGVTLHNPSTVFENNRVYSVGGGTAKDKVVVWHNATNVNEGLLAAGYNITYTGVETTVSSNSIFTTIVNPAGGTNSIQASLDTLWNYNYLASTFTVNNADLLAASMVEVFRNSDYVYIDSKLNSSATSDNVINFPNPADSLEFTRVIVTSRDLDTSSASEDEDTELQTTPGFFLYKNSLLAEYTLAAGETTELVCQNVDGTWYWVIVSATNGDQSSATFNTASPTIYMERNTHYKLDAATAGATTYTFDVSDLAPGDTGTIVILGADSGTATLDLTSGNWVYDNLSGDGTEVFSGVYQSFTWRWNGTNMDLMGQ